jgi:hypothetical protein
MSRGIHGDKKLAFRVLMRKPETKGPSGRCWLECEQNIKMNMNVRPRFDFICNRIWTNGEMVLELRTV